MLKRILFAVAPMMLIASSVMANDDLLSKIAKMDTTDIKDSIAAVDEIDELGQADVDALLGDIDEESSEDAVAACFRRIGYGYGHRSYRSYHCGFHYNWCSPVRYTCYPTYHYRPVHYRCYTPVYTSYWGCW
ncbi:MAG: hypothetical protein HKN47_01960 [Pirellulaceae bacterium]|nr:hypothetical protein [Pirellulaceae bacterium]